MDWTATIAATVGVIGTLIATTVAQRNAAQVEERRFKRDQEVRRTEALQARAERTFTERRDAYVELLTELRSYEQAAFDWYERNGDMPVPEDAGSRLHEIGDRVALYGTQEAAESAKAVVGLWLKMIHGDAYTWDELEAARGSFLRQARTDLGILP